MGARRGGDERGDEGKDVAIGSATEEVGWRARRRMCERGGEAKTLEH